MYKQKAAYNYMAFVADESSLNERTDHNKASNISSDDVWQLANNTVFDDSSGHLERINRSACSNLYSKLPLFDHSHVILVFKQGHLCHDRELLKNATTTTLEAG